MEPRSRGGVSGGKAVKNLFVYRTRPRSAPSPPGSVPLWRYASVQTGSPATSFKDCRIAVELGLLLAMLATTPSSVAITRVYAWPAKPAAGHRQELLSTITKAALPSGAVKFRAGERNVEAPTSSSSGPVNA